MSSFFMTILNMSLTASYVALIVMAIRFVLGKLRVPRVFSYALWAVVLFRLVFPISFESAFSLIPAKTNAIPHDIGLLQSPAVNTGFAIIDNTVNNAIQVTVPPIEVAASVNSMQVILNIGTLVWLLGIGLLFGYALFSYLGLKRRLAFATRVEGHIFETDQIQTPFVMGFIKPRIYLPTGLGEQYKDYIIKHEQTHLRRYDHLIKPLAFFTLVLHWFNPLIWLSYFLMIKDMEMSCDERVMKETNDDVRSDYSRTLLALASKQSSLLGPLSFGESNVKSRVRNILHYKRPVFWVGAIATVIVLAVSVSAMANPISHVEGQTDEEQQIVNLVEGFGSKLSMVSLLAPKAEVAKSMEETYRDFVSQDLIKEWIENPEIAPGRLTSSPWPERIDVTDVIKRSSDLYEVTGVMIEVTSAEMAEGGVAARRPITLEVRQVGGQWLIDACRVGSYEINQDKDIDVIPPPPLLVTNDDHRVQSVAGYIVLEKNTLYLDEVEVITTESLAQMLGLNLYDPDRIDELELTTGDMPNGYYIHNPSTETVSFELTDDTIYDFTDHQLLFVEHADGNRHYRTTKKDEFIQHLDTSYSNVPRAGTVPFFIEVQDGKVIRITEKFIFTQ